MKLWRQIVEKFNSPVVRFFLVIGAIITTGILSSWTSSSSAGEFANSVIRDQIKTIVAEVVDEKLAPVMNAIASDVAQTKKEISILNLRTYKDIIRQIEKTYETIKKGDFEDIKKSNVEAYISDWKILPDEYKTDTVVVKYNAMVRWYEAQ